MKKLDTELPGCFILEPVIHGDDRGFFMESWNRDTFRSLGINLEFVQDNHSRSSHGVLRGIHYQIDKPQGKLVRVTQGSVFDVAVDIRRKSPSFGRWTGVELSADNKRMMWVPPGFAHAFLVLSDTADFQYKCTELYIPECDRGIRWNDPDIGIKWPELGVKGPSLSDKDRSLPLLVDAELDS
jgi:dTDP-4-dehydrorhamnose 3,5-epimerase